MKKIAVMGNSDSVKGFAALGLDIFEVDEQEAASKTIRRLANGEYAIIYITEKLFEECETEILRYTDRELPAIIPIPGTYGNTGIGMKNVSRSVERAVGSDMIFND